MTFSEHIKQLRTEHNLTQEEVAQKLHVTRQTISNWENGNNYPDLDTLTAISKLYDISVDELLDGDKKLTSNIQRAFSLFHVLILVGIYFAYLGAILLYFWFSYRQIPIRSTILFILTALLGGVGIIAINYIGREFNGLNLQLSHVQASFAFNTQGSTLKSVITYYLTIAVITIVAFLIPDTGIRIVADIIIYAISGFVIVEGLLLAGASLLAIKAVHHFNIETAKN